ncbi:hypothetical protein ACEPAI_7134 [Sanghuangporus weigelae]
MSPSFYEPSSSSAHTLFNHSTLHHPSKAASDNSLPTLAVVLGLIGVLVALALIACIFIYMFRSRLFPPPAEFADDEEKLRSGPEPKVFYKHTNRFCTLDDATIASHAEVEASIANRPPLQPFLFNPAKPAKPHYKELLLPRLQQIQSNLTGNHDTMNPKIFHNDAPYGYEGSSFKYSAPCVRAEVSSSSIKVSQSCPASIGQSPDALNENALPSRVIADSSEGKPKRLELIRKLPPTPPPLMYSFDSTSSVYSEDSVYSFINSDDESVDWDYYINDRHEGLFYQPESSSSSLPPVSISQEARRSEATIGATIHETDAKSEEANLDFSASAETRRPTRRMCYAIPLSKRAGSAITSKHRLNSRLVKHYGTRLCNASCAWRLFKLRSGAANSCICRRRYFVSRHDSQAIPGPRTTIFSDIGSTPPYLTRTPPRVSSRQPISIPLDTPLSGMTKQSTMKRAPMSSPPAIRPSLLINGIPATDLGAVATMSPPQFNRLLSPPRNPELLNTRWAPRPATPPLNVTVFAKKDCSAAPSSLMYPGRRVTITPPAGTSLVELRGLVERALGHDVRTLRGMVFIGSRSMFLPLVSERFFAQWVKERIRDGGTGIVEAWYN